MSGVRSSFVFGKEDEFKGGLGKNNVWIAPPPGSFLSTTHNRATTKVYTAGSKKWDTVAYGQMTGSFEWTFIMDYGYIEPLILAFDKVELIGDEMVLTKENYARIPSFTIRKKVLNEIAGGPTGKDETMLYTGCVVKTCRFSKSAGASQIGVTLSGFYAHESMDLTSLDTTDYQEYDEDAGGIVEFSCMFVGDIAPGNYVANTESLSLGIENSAAAVFSTCSPFASTYSEGQTSFTFGTTCYSNDPEHYKTRLYCGGAVSNANGAKGTSQDNPLSKNLHPIELINLASYSGESNDETADISTTYANSNRHATFEMNKTVIKSLTWQKGDGSKLQDQINSTEVRDIKLRIKNTLMFSMEKVNAANIWTEANPHRLLVQ